MTRGEEETEPLEVAVGDLNLGSITTIDGAPDEAPVRLFQFGFQPGEGQSVSPRAWPRNRHNDLRRRG